MQVAENKVVSIHYTLTDDTGETLDSSEGNPPLDYIQGQGNIIPGLEKALDGKEIGDKLRVTIAPEEAYGMRDEEMIQTVPRKAFQGVEDIQPGMQFQAQSPQGVQLITITAVEGDDITIDGNHPLAGVTLTFDVEITAVRDATEEELSHGHAHSAGGHQH